MKGIFFQTYNLLTNFQLYLVFINRISFIVTNEKQTKIRLYHLGYLNLNLVSSSQESVNVQGIVTYFPGSLDLLKQKVI